MIATTRRHDEPHRPLAAVVEVLGQIKVIGPLAVLACDRAADFPGRGIETGDACRADGTFVEFLLDFAEVGLIRLRELIQAHLERSAAVLACQGHRALTDLHQARLDRGAGGARPDARRMWLGGHGRRRKRSGGHSRCDALHPVRAPASEKHLHDGAVDHLHSKEDGIHGGVNQPKIR